MSSTGRKIGVIASALTIFIVIVSILVATAHADSIGDKVDEARIKARAGDVELALELLDELADEHPDDVRIHYYRSKFLRDLDRHNSAADALEITVEKMAKYVSEGGKDSKILGLQSAIEKDSKALLKYRKEVRKILKDYRAKATPLVDKLLEEKRLDEASYVIDELNAAIGTEDKELKALREKVNEALKTADDEEE